MVFNYMSFKQKRDLRSKDATKVRQKKRLN